MNKLDDRMLEDTDPRAHVSTADRSSAWAHALWLAPFALAVAPTVSWLLERYWTLNVWSNGHGIFMPLISGYLVWQALRDDPSEREESSPWGLALLSLGMGLIALDAAIRSQLLAAVGLVIAVPGISLLLLGYRRTRAIAFPLIILGFMLPIPAGFASTLYLWLREVTAIGTTELISISGLAIAREGTVLFLPGTTVNVADECSGFATLYAAMVTALILAHLSRSLVARSALLLMAPMLAMAANVVRVSILTFGVYRYGTGILDTAIHAWTGLAAFAFVVVALFLVAGREAVQGTRA